MVAADLLVTCAHVLEDGGYGTGDMVELAFPHAPGAPTVTGRALEDGWREPQEQDIALVRLDRPVGAAPLALGSAAGCRGHRVRSFGFPQQAPPGGHFGYASAGDLLPAAGSSGDLLQLTGANDLTTGFSGGPVLNEVTGLVVGMLTSITAPDAYDRGLGIAYATPTTVLREVWPALGEHDVSPYRALEPFTAEHARWFRGREEAVRQVLTGLAGRRRVVLLLGPSGSGKSSLVQAGVLPALADGRLPGSDRWRQVLTRPGPDLQAALERAGLSAAPAAAIETTVTDPLTVDLVPERVVLVIDQFEELLTPTGGPQTLETLQRITQAVDSHTTVNVLLVMRDDFYARLSAMAPGLLRAALHSRGVLNVPAVLTGEELDAIVTGPARDLEVGFEDGLAQRIVADVLALNPHAATDAEAPVTVLPLLEVALTRLWERRGEHDGRLTHDAYRRIGAVTGALADWCDAALGELDERQRGVAQRILTALVRPADETLRTPAVRQQLPLDALRDLAADGGTPEALAGVDEVLAVLVRHRIVTTDRLRESGPAEGEGTPVVELIHDALIRDWGALRGWVEQDARFHDWLHRARLQYARWQQHRDPQDLPGGTFLAEGTEWARNRRLPADLESFINAGRRRQRGAIRRSRRLNIILSAVLVLALTASGVAFWQWRASVTAQLAAQSRQLAAQSTSLIGADPDRASLLAVAAYRSSPTEEAIASLSAAANLPLRHRLTGHTRGVNCVAFSPDGHTLATGGGNDSVRLYDVATGRTVTTLGGTGGKFLMGHSGDVDSVAFSPDGNILAATSRLSGVRLWDVVTGTTVATLAGPTHGAFSVAFSPDGHTLATGDSDNVVRLWDAATGSTVAALTGHTDDVLSVAFSPDGRTLATASSDGTARLWDIARGTTLSTLTGHADDVYSVAFSPDGHTLATGGRDGTALLWDVTLGTTVTTLTGHTNSVTSVAFSPDGHTVSTASLDGTARLWDVATGTTVTTLTGHTGGVESAAFRPDGRTLATGGRDSTARLWDLTVGTSRTTATTLSGHTDAVTSVAFSPDGHTLATASSDGTARLWDMATGTTITTLTGHTGEVLSVAFSPDGHTLATASSDGTTRLWDVTTGTTTATLTGHADEVRSVAFSPDGHTLATASRDMTVRLWDVTTGAAITTLTGHGLGVLSVVFSPDGHTLATASLDGRARLWDVTTGAIIATLTGHSVRSMAFSPDGHTLATASLDSPTALWDPATGTSVTATDSRATSVAFSPDGRTLAAAEYSSPVALRDVHTGALITALTGQSGGVNSVVFSPDGRTVATASSDGTARLWPYAAPDTAIRAVCEAVARDLTDSEQAFYLPDRPLGPICPA
ncbi:trypsin-like peptidase domain-containing protein [Kitasatospora sp. NPDC048365]|uniref:nSTAND1 domain-containing NTPase n=1 Tax=Kitasatospora sp. NPDC048365 TaxID=3364050 RepID=UPI003720F27D